MQTKNNILTITCLLLSLFTNISFTFAGNQEKIQNSEKTFTSKEIEKIYAPVLYFDSKEKVPLTSVEIFLKTGVSLVAYKDDKEYKVIKKNIKPEDMANYPSRYIFQNNEKLELAFQTENKISLSKNIVYTRKIIKNEFTYIQYWFLYSFNDVSGIGGFKFLEKCGDHQADWEHISLKINNSRFKKSKNEKNYINSIEEIFFAQHNRGQYEERKFKKPNDNLVSFIGTHIRAFVARGTHATFYQYGEYNIANLLVLKLKDYADGKGRILYSENYLSSFQSNSWSKYGGRWGQISNDYCNIAESWTTSSNDGELNPLKQVPGTDWDYIN